MTDPPLVVKTILIPLVLIAAICDIRTRRIPNWLTLAGVFAGVVVNAWRLGGNGLKMAGLGFGVALLIYLPLFWLRAVGGGDVKLMAAAGALVGPGNWVAIFALSGVTGGLVAVGILLRRGRLGRALSNAGFILGELARFRAPYARKSELDIGHPRAVTLPHAVAIAIGSLLFLLLAAPE